VGHEVTLFQGRKHHQPVKQLKFTRFMNVFIVSYAVFPTALQFVPA